MGVEFVNREVYNFDDRTIITIVQDDYHALGYCDLREDYNFYADLGDIADEDEREREAQELADLYSFRWPVEHTNVTFDFAQEYLDTAKNRVIITESLLSGSFVDEVDDEDYSMPDVLMRFISYFFAVSILFGIMYLLGAF